MTAAKGYYATIQVCPDPSRLETVNVGALLFCPGRHFLKAEFAADFRRAKKLFGSLDESFLEMQKQALVDRLDQLDEFGTIEDLQGFMDRRAGALRFSPMRPMQVTNPNAELPKLFERLVGRERPRRQSGSRAKTLFAKALQKEHLIDHVRRPISVELPQIGKVLRASFGYRNGRYNVIDPVDFVREDGWFQSASARAIEGQALHRIVHSELGRMNLVVVGRFAGDAQKHSEAVKKILSDHNVVLYELDRIGPLLADIRGHIAA